MMRSEGFAGLLACAAVLTAGCASGTSAAPARSSTGAPAASGRPPSTEPTQAAALAGTAVCQLLEKINTAAATATSPTQGLTVLREYSSQLTAAVRNAVPAARADLTVLSAATDKAVASGDVSGLAADPVVAAGANLLSLCGQDAPLVNPTKN